MLGHLASFTLAKLGSPVLPMIYTVAGIMLIGPVIMACTALAIGCFIYEATRPDPIEED